MRLKANFFFIYGCLNDGNERWELNFFVESIDEEFSTPWWSPRSDAGGEWSELDGGDEKT